MILASTLIALLFTPGTGGDSPTLRVERGMRATVLMPSPRGRLRPLPGQGPSSDILVRVSEPDASGAQQIEFVGQRPGVYDLSGFVQLSDGNNAAGLPPVPVEIVSRFPPGSEAGLARTELPTTTFGSNYTHLAILAWVGWGAIGATLLIFRAAHRRRRRPLPTSSPVPAPTERTELVALLDRAATESLGPGTLARLELLLVRELTRREFSVASPQSPRDVASALETLRLKPAEGAALRDLERWLHSGEPRTRLSASDAVRSARLALDHIDSLAPVGSRSRGGVA